MAISVLLAGTQGARAQNPQTALPELPHPAFDRMVPTVRAEVEVAYQNALAHPQDAEANGRLGMVFEAHNFLAEAEICYLRAHKLEPVHGEAAQGKRAAFRWAYYLGVVQTDQAKCNDSIPAFREALEIRPDYFPAQLRLAECLLVSVDYDEAGKLYESLVRQHPENAEVYYGLGRVRAARGDLNGAIESFRKATKIFPGFGAAHHWLAKMYQRTGKPAEAREELEISKKSQGLLPTVPDPLLDDVMALYKDYVGYLKLASRLGSEGELEGATAAYEKALEINPQLPQAHARLIYLYGRAGRRADAEKEFRTAVALDPKIAEAYFDYGALLMPEGRSREAAEAFRKALEINPHYAQAHNNLGYLLEGEGKLAEAEAEFQQALRDDPDFPQAHFSLGRILVKQGNFGDGIPHLLKALKRADEESKATYLHATSAAFADAGDLENALRYLRLAKAQAEAEGDKQLLRNIDDDFRLLAGEAPRRTSQGGAPHQTVQGGTGPP